MRTNKFQKLITETKYTDFTITYVVKKQVWRISFRSKKPFVTIEDSNPVKLINSTIYILETFRIEIKLTDL